MYTLKIHVTKEILQKSAMCGTDGAPVNENCAFALALREIFPDAVVGAGYTFPFGYKDIDVSRHLYWTAVAGDQESMRMLCVVKNTEQMRFFISRFDITSPLDRKNIEPKVFELDIPDYVIKKIDITEIQNILADVPHLELVEA